MAVTHGDGNEDSLKKDNNKLFKSFQWKTKWISKILKHLS